MTPRRQTPLQPCHTLLPALLLCLTLSGPAAAEDKAHLDFVNADLPTVIQTVGKMTGRAFVVDPRVKGVLNLSTPKPVSKSVAYDLLLTALRMQGYTAVESNGVVRVVPEAEAKFHAQPVDGKRQGKVTAGQMASRVFRLKHESANQMAVVLKPLVGPNSVVSSDPGSNSLLVTDYADNLTRLAQIIESMDVPDASEPVLIPLKHASAQEVANLIGRLMGPASTAGQNASDVQRVDLAVDARSNSLLIRSDSPARLARVQSLVASLDVPTPAAGNVHVVYLKNAEAVKVAPVLRGILTREIPAATAVPAGAQQAAAPRAADPGGMVLADASINALIVTAPEAQFQHIKTVIDKLDVRRAQVLVEALIAEVSADKAAEFGIQWMYASGLTGNSAAPYAGFGNSSSSSNIGKVAQNPANAMNGLNLGVVRGSITVPGVSGSIANIGVLARALETTTNANILSTPTLLSLDNEEAKITIGANVPFQTGQYTISSGSSASPFTTYERKDVGLTLKIKPQISEGGTVRLQVNQEVSKLRSSDTVLASTDKRSIDTTVLVDDGQIVVIGGLIDDQVQDVEDKVPLLGDIPLLGRLFRYDRRQHTKTNLMVFLRPVIVRDAKTAAQVSNSRYEYMQGQEKAIQPQHKPLLPDAQGPVLKYDLNLSAPSPAAKP